MRRQALHAIIKHCRLIQLGPLLLKHWRIHTLVYCLKLNFIPIQWVGQPNPYHTLLHCRSTPCLNTLMGTLRYLVTLLRHPCFFKLLTFNQHFTQYNAELYPILTHCSVKHDLVTLLSNSQFSRMDERNRILTYYEVQPVFLHCRAVSDLITLLWHILCKYIAELFPILIHCWGISYLITLMTFSQS